MYNWSTDEKILKKNKKSYAIWCLEQTINFGLDGEKINKKTLQRYWAEIQIDPARRRYLEVLLNE